MTAVTGNPAPLPPPATATPPPSAKPTISLGDRIFKGASVGAGGFMVLLVTLVGVFLVATALPALVRNQANFVTSMEWSVNNPDAMRFGIFEMLWVTVASSVIAMAIAVPLGVGVALFITEYAPGKLGKTAATLIDLLAAVPSIVYGIWGITVVGPLVVPLQQFLASALGWIPFFAPPPDADGVRGDATTVTTPGTIFFIGVVLAIMVLPIVTAISREVFSQTPSMHKEGALALGATKWEMIRTAILPFGKPGVISAAMLALGRALGETVAVMIIVSTLAAGTPWDATLLRGGETFASRIANNAAEFDSVQKTGAFIAAGLVLFILTFAVNAIARIVIERRKAFSE